MKPISNDHEDIRPRRDSGTHRRTREQAILELSVGDITAQDVDALITATGYGAHGRSAVELAVRRRAGPELERAYDASTAGFDGALPVGALVVTDGFALPARRVIHCRPPSFDETRSSDAARTLGAVVRGALGRASEEGARSIAIASLGTGAYGFPAHVAAPSSLAEVALWLSRSSGSALARIVVFGPGMLTAYAEAAMRVLPSFVPVPLATGGLSVEIPRDASR